MNVKKSKKVENSTDNKRRIRELRRSLKLSQEAFLLSIGYAPSASFQSNLESERSTNSFISSNYIAAVKEKWGLDLNLPVGVVQVDKGFPVKGAFAGTEQIYSNHIIEGDGVYFTVSRMISYGKYRVLSLKGEGVVVETDKLTIVGVLID